MTSRNVLLLIADDLGKNLGCYGDKVIKTPRLDALAASGCRFDLAFASTASCSGSRSTIYTGLHTHANGQYGLTHGRHHFVCFDNVDSLPRLFNEAGYLTGIIGKIHVGPGTVFPWTVQQPTSPSDRDVNLMADKAGEFFQRAKDEGKPFHLSMGFHDPHRDSTRGGFANRPDYPGVTDIKYDPENMVVPPYLTDVPEVRTELAEYYRSISRLDQGVGMVLDRLDKAGLTDSTLVVFVSDNGAPFVNSKTTTYDAGVCLPLIVKHPSGPSSTTSDAMVSFVDLLPTFLDYCDIVPVLKTETVPLQGRSFLSVLQDPAGASAEQWSKVFGSHTFHGITEYYPTRYFRDRRFKYHRNVAWKLDFPFASDLRSSNSWDAMKDVKTDGRVVVGTRSLEQYIRRRAEELYDLSADPQEVKDLSQDPDYQNVLRSMREVLEQWQMDTQDPWLFRDGTSVLGVQNALNEGMRLADRFDFDWADPKGEDVKLS